MQMLQGRATAEGTTGYAKRFSELTGNYRPMLDGLAVSSLGLGTYLGASDPAADAAYGDSIRAALLGGINLLDTAVNYRDQRSERVIGAVLAELVAPGKIQRDEIVVATKGGYLAFDGTMPPDPRGWFEDNFIRPGIVSPGDLVQGSHCITPRYLDAMIETSRKNLGLETIDIYYLHNPEAQLDTVSPGEFRERIAAAFTMLERAVSEGRIAVYGTATWSGYRVAMNDRSHLSLVEMVAIARQVGGDHHHFRVIQLPYNLAMTEALTAHNQALPDDKAASLLGAADLLGIAVCASASMLQGQLTRGLPAVLSETFPALDSDAQRALQFVRSTPGVNVALIGMSSVAHVAHNLGVARHPPASFETLLRLFRPAKPAS
jgi:aryl-alcohol dehydrogenase-like predicted oxidoreductase